MGCLSRPRERRLTLRRVVVGLLCCLFASSMSRPLCADSALDDYNLAVGLYKQKRWELAAESFRKFVKDNPEHERIPYARLYLGLTLVNSEKYGDARQVLRGFVKDYPQSRNLPDALYRVAECSYLL